MQFYSVTTGEIAFIFSFLGEQIFHNVISVFQLRFFQTYRCQEQASVFYRGRIFSNMSRFLPVGRFNGLVTKLPPEMLFRICEWMFKSHTFYYSIMCQAVLSQILYHQVEFNQYH